MFDTFKTLSTLVAYDTFFYVLGISSIPDDSNIPAVVNVQVFPYILYAYAYLMLVSL